MKEALWRLGPALVVTSIAIACPAQIVPNLTSLPAGANGASLRATVENLVQGSNINVCFYTGFGGSAPIVPDSLTYQGSSALIAFQVAPSAIQTVPPESFNSGTFPALLYTVDPAVTRCTGSAQAQSNAATISLQYPALSSLSLSSVPHLNPKLTSVLPTRIALTGSNFLSGTSVSSVLFNSTGSSISGNASFISSTTLVSTVPTTLPLNVSSVSVQVCNTAVYSYCSATKKLGLTTVPASPGVVNASAGTRLPSQPVTISSTFGPAKPSIAGATGGIVDFHYASTELGTAPLILDNSGVFVAAPVTGIHAAQPLGSPIIADFNQDGIPDLLLPEVQSNTLHLLLGATPLGSYAADLPLSFQVDGSNLLIRSAAVADFNHDGFPDIAILGHTADPADQPNAVYLLINDGSGHFQQPALAFASAFGSSIVAGDFDRDGKQDIVVAGPVSSTTGFQVLRGDGLGGFAAGPISPGLNTAPTSFGGYKIVAANFSNDASPDIAVLNGGSADGSQLTQAVAVFQNDGTGAFSLSSSIPTDAASSSTFYAASLGNNQPLAIVLVSPSSATISIAQNQSTSSIAFSNALATTSVPFLKQAIVGDFNADGLLDLAVDDGTTVHVLNGDGKGAFLSIYSGLSTPSFSGMTLLAASDENADTFADLLTLTTSGADAYAVNNFITAGTATATLPAMTFPPGLHVIQARTPGTFTIECGSVTGNLTIMQLAPTITWPSPAPIVAGTPLSAAQLDATVTASDGTSLSGRFTYKPALGAILSTGTQTLTVVFTPTNSDYAPITASVSLNVIVFALSGLSTTSAALGDPATAIILTGSGFLSSAVIQMDQSPVATTYINQTTLSAVIPARDFRKVHTIQVAVADATLGLTTPALGINVLAPPTAIDFSGPTSIAPGTQVTLNFKLTAAYPVDVTATFTIAFAPVAGLPNDPGVQFSAGGRTLVVTIPAGTTTLDPVAIQAGTVAGSLTVTTQLEAGDADVTPILLKPLTIQAGLAAPGITSVSFAGNGNILTVTVRGFSNTREIVGAKFHFAPAAGATINTPDVAIDAQALYASWYSSDASLQYGSTCTYTQVFNLSTDASAVGQVSAILTNTQGASPEVTTP